MMDFDFTLPGLGRPVSQRPKRVAEAIRNELSVLLLREVGDPRLAGVSFSQVVVSPDLKQARIYFVLSAGNVDEADRALERAKGFFRSRLARTLNLRYTPRLSFHYDAVHDEVERVEALLQEIGRQHDDRKDG